MLFRKKQEKAAVDGTQPVALATNNDNQKPIILGAAAGRQRRMPKQIAIYAGVVLAGAACSYLLLTNFGTKVFNKNQNKNGVPIIVVDGKEYTADYINNPPDSSQFTKETPTPEQYIKEGEEAVAKGRADYEVFAVLGSLYADRGEFDKARQAYLSAKQQVSPTDPEYQGKIDAMDQNIAALESGAQ